LAYCFAFVATNGTCLWIEECALYYFLSSCSAYFTFGSLIFYFVTEEVLLWITCFYSETLIFYLKTEEVLLWIAVYLVYLSVDFFYDKSLKDSVYNFEIFWDGGIGETNDFLALN
jgi:hypothetical protein